MLDQLSNYPSPQGHEAASLISSHINSISNIRSTNRNKKFNEILKTSNVSNTTFFNEALKLVIEEPPQFSLAAWHMGGEEDYCNRVLNICYEKYVIKKQRIRKLRGIIRTIALIKRLYDDTLERYYQPGGGFETNAALIWNPIMKIDNKKGFVKKIKQEVYYNRI